MTGETRQTKISGYRAKKKGPPFFEITIGAVLTLWAVLIVFPFFNVIAVSFATEKEYLLAPYMFFPLKPTLENYIKLVNDSRIFIGYRTTLIFLIIGLPYNMGLTMCTAYALSRPSFPGKKFFMYYIVFTMYFSGGIIPLYLWIRDLHLTDTIWSVILPYGVNTFYMLIMRNYIMGLPASIAESARMDGAGELHILARIILPLSKPILATFGLFFAVDRWNEWYTAMIFIKSQKIMPLQLVLRTITISTQAAKTMALGAVGIDTALFSRGLKAAAVIVTMAPIMFAYPFLQRYFVKGIALGAVKS
ncbi:MAG: carbohydrate ABC transporter permease [Treponema sp.]|jgi:putative aldouronate transport system permease protein|nr:carbohydrate ABC transporter permease [Treponema sp.]